MALDAYGASPEGGTCAAFGGRIVPVDAGRGGKTALLGYQEPLSRDTEGGMVVKAAPAPSFVVV
jgi:hypothetical protein